MILLCVLVASAFPVSAEREPQTTVRVGCVDIDNFLVTDRNGNVSGYGAEYLEKIAEYTGWQYEYVHGTWNECIEWLRSGKIDLLFPAERTAEREQKFLFSDSACCTDYAALLTAESNQTLYYDDVDSLQGITVGMISGNYLNDLFEEYCTDHELVCKPIYYDTGTQLLKALEQGQVDAIVHGNLNIGSGQKVLLRFDYMPAYFVTHTDGQALMDKLNHALYQINLEDPYFTAQLVEKYYGQASLIPQSFTKEETDYIKTSKPLRVVCDSHNYPFEWYNSQTRRYEGINTDLLQLIAKKSGLTLEFIKTDSLKESWDMMRNGQADLIAGVYSESQLEKEYHLRFSNSYYNEEFAVVGRSADYPSKNSSLKIAIPSSFVSTQRYIESHFSNWVICTTDSVEQCIDMVENKTADLMLANAMQIQATGLLCSSDTLTVFSTLSCSVPVCFGIAEENSELLDSVLNKSILLVSDAERSQIVLQNNVRSPQTFSVRMFIQQKPEWFAVILAFICLLLVSVVLLLSRWRFRVKQARKLEQINKELEAASRAKSEFLSRMSHDMRTPMNAILGLLELSFKEPMTLQLKKNLRQIGETGRFLLDLINDTLDMNKIENKRTELHLEPVLVNHLILVVTDMIFPVAEKKKVAFRLRKTGDLQQTLLVDRVHMQRVLMNLLSNAVKFTPAGGIVVFSTEISEVRPSLVRCKFVVEDTGEGISPEFMPKLFVPFEQEQRAGSLAYGGTGLGLSIVKNLVDLMGGTISVESQLGKGTKAVLTLECQQVKVLAWKKAEKEPTPYMLQGKRVLLCEDDAINTQIVTAILKRQECAVECDTNGQDGVEHFSQSEEYYFDAILMDMCMPIMNGLEAARQIRSLKREDAKNIPIIAMTANAYDDVQNCLDAGMNCQLCKPVNAATLCNTLEEQIKCSLWH